MPNEWSIAINNINCRTVSAVGKICGNKQIEIAPYETISVNCLVRGIDSSVNEVLTENFDNEANYVVCPRVVRLHNQGNNKISVSVCNLTGKTLTLQPK